MTKFIAVFLLALLTGCATSSAILAPYESPVSCAEIDAEMQELAEHDATIYTLRGLKEGVAFGLGGAAAAGALPIGWAWAPIAAAFLPQIKAQTYGERIAFLAIARETRQCPTDND